jgi:hypothetical protein
MDILVRNYLPSDATAVAAVYRDSLDGLRKSKGGSHGDDYVDRMLSKTDEQIMKKLLYSNEFFVAQVRESGEVVGIGGITNRLKHRILGSAYSANLYVKRKFQRGRSGIPVGSLIRSATIERAKSLGFRKLYGYATPEAVNFQKKHGAALYPSHNTKRSGSDITVHYYEVELKKHPLNAIRIEPYVSELSFLSRLLLRLRALGGDFGTTD